MSDLPAVKAGGGQTSTEGPALIDSQRPGLAALLQDVSLYYIIILACHAFQAGFSCQGHHGSSMETCQAAGREWPIFASL